MDFKPSPERQILFDTLKKYFENEYSLSDRNIAAHSDLGYSKKAFFEYPRSECAAILRSERLYSFSKYFLRVSNRICLSGLGLKSISFSFL